MKIQCLLTCLWLFRMWLSYRRQQAGSTAESAAGCLWGKSRQSFCGLANWSLKADMDFCVYPLSKLLGQQSAWLCFLRTQSSSVITATWWWHTSFRRAQESFSLSFFSFSFVPFTSMKYDCQAKVRTGGPRTQECFVGSTGKGVSPASE